MPRRPPRSNVAPGASPRLAPASTVSAWRRAARNFYRAHHLESPGVEADLLLRHVLELRAVDLTLEKDRVLTQAQRRRLSRLAGRRAARVPLQYLTGTVDFYGRRLRVTPAVLIPRPETEGLVDRVLSFLRASPADSAGAVLDVGTGSGAIAITVAGEAPDVPVWATELSPSAARVARANVREHGLSGRVRVFCGDLTAPITRRTPPARWRVLVSNPPYIGVREKGTLDPEVAEHEPELALFAPQRGLGIIRRLAPEAAALLSSGALFALEIGERLGDEVSALLKAQGAWRDIRVERDLAGRDRYVLARRI